MPLDRLRLIRNVFGLYVLFSGREIDLHLMQKYKVGSLTISAFFSFRSKAQSDLQVSLLCSISDSFFCRYNVDDLGLNNRLFILL